MKEALQEEWDKITLEEIRHRIADMPRRCGVLIRSNGGLWWPILLSVPSWLFTAAGRSFFFLSSECSSCKYSSSDLKHDFS